MHVRDVLMAAAGVAVMAAGWGAAPAGAAELTIHRGAEVRALAGGREQAAPSSAVTPKGVTVVRGRAPAPRVEEDITVTLREADRRAPLQVVAGETVWLVDRKTGRLVGCELVETTNVGATRIRCRGRSLPR